MKSPQPAKVTGSRLASKPTNSVIYANFESQVKELERTKEKLQKDDDRT
jgi:hypothetical protein